MAPAAPGQASSHQEPYCYNCGMNGHWMFACPEPTRAVPAGLKQWQSKHHDQGPDRNKSSRDGKGSAVITRYPPPLQVGPPAPYGTPTSQPPPPPAYPPAGSPPAPHGYPQPYPPLPPGYGNNYSPSGPPPPPHYPHYSPGPPPAGPPPGPPPPGPPPGSYGQHQPPYPPPQYPPYPPQGYYQNGPPPPPPGPLPPGTYQPQQYPPQGPYPPPPDYHCPPAPPSQYGPPPPPANVSPYPATHWPPQPPGYGLPPPPAAFTPPAAASLPRSRDNRNSRDQRDYRDRRDRQNGDRGRHQNRDDTRRTPNSQKDRGRPNIRDHSSTPVQNRANPPKDPQRDHSASHKEKPVKHPLPPVPPPARKDAPEKEKDEDKGKLDASEEISFSQKDLAIVFPEPGKTKEADPVGIPLPTEYNDDPTIPPAYNAKVIKSSFFDEHNDKEFSASIRDSSDWNRLKEDPAFKFYDGMISRRFSSSSYSYPAYSPSSPPSPSVPIKLPPRLKIDRKALDILRGKMLDFSDESAPLKEEKEKPQPSGPNKRHMDDLERQGDRESKRAKPSPPRQSSIEGHPRPASLPKRPPRSPRSSLGRDPLDSLPEEVSDYERRPSSRNSHTRPSPASDDRQNRPNIRHDSGYYSGQSQDKYRSRKERDPEPVRGKDRDRDRVHTRRIDHGDRDRRLSDDDSDHRPGGRGRYQRRDSRSLSRSMSPPPRRRRSTSWGSRDSYDSFDNGGDRSPQTNDLSLLDYELLGLAGPDEPLSPVKEKKKKKTRKEIEEERRLEEQERRREEERERREERKRFNPPPKKRKPAREVTAAFSRRW